MLLDIHTHHAAQAAGGKGILSLDLTQADEGDLAPTLLYSLAIHPWTLHLADMHLLLGRLLAYTTHPQVVAVGEAGLDKLRGAPLDYQLKVLRLVASAAEALQLPLILHNVRAANELVALRRELRPACPWVLHGFRGKPELARELTERHGFYLSFGERFNENAVQAIPADRLCVETDESLLPVEATLARIASLRGVTPESLATQLQTNYHTLFTRLPHPLR